MVSPEIDNEAGVGESSREESIRFAERKDTTGEVGDLTLFE